MKTENIFGVEVSEDVFTTEFSCDYDVCKGACCYSPLPSGSKVHAVGGGLTKDEYAEVLDRKKDIAQYVAPEMAKKFHRCPTCQWNTEEGVTEYAVETYKGVVCLLSRMDRGCCAIEAMHEDGKGLSFPIPVNCSLYPLVYDPGKKRLYVSHLWDEQCGAAYEKGHREHVRAYEFVKNSILRLFGEPFYEELCKRAKEYEK